MTASSPVTAPEVARHLPTPWSSGRNAGGSAVPVVLNPNAPAAAAHLERTEEEAPAGWLGWIRTGYRRRMGAYGVPAANEWAGRLSLDLAKITRGTAGEDAAIRKKADHQAERVTLAALAQPWPEARKRAEVAARQTGVEEPCGDHDQAAALRGQCPQWWRRQLRRQVGRGVEAAARRMGMVRKGGQLYVSDETLARHRSQKSRNRALLETLLAVNEQGQEYTLQELADLSEANPQLRRHELMARIRGTEELADGAGHRAAFWTLTTPSRFHPVRQGRGGKVLDNPRWDGSSPREAQHYLRDLWARVRAAWHRAGIEPYGLRVAEPHHDGTPHWHLLLFLPEHQAAEADRIFRAYALAESPDEPGAADHRLRTEWIDPERGTATGYVAKYIAKAVDGHAVDQDLFGGDGQEAAARIAAWASTWGIRQFQFLGTPPVTLWREVRRLEGAPAGPLGDAFAAADAGNWRRFAEVVAGAPGLATVKAEPALNRYGETAAPRAYGVVEPDTGEIFVTRRHTWAIGPPAEARRAWTRERPAAALRRMGQARIDYPITKHEAARQAAERYAREARNETQDADAGEGGRGGSGNRAYRSARGGHGGRRRRDVSAVDVAGGAAAGPWTGVNNCTEGRDHGKRERQEAAGGAGSPGGIPGAAEPSGQAGRPGGRYRRSATPPSRAGRGGVGHGKPGDR